MDGRNKRVGSIEIKQDMRSVQFCDAQGLPVSFELRPLSDLIENQPAALAFFFCTTATALRFSYAVQKHGYQRVEIDLTKVEPTQDQIPVLEFAEFFDGVMLGADIDYNPIACWEVPMQ